MKRGLDCVDLEANSNCWLPWQPSKINSDFVHPRPSWTSTAMKTFLMTKGRDYSQFSRFFGSSKRASIRKPLLASLKRGLLSRIPKTNSKKILQRMMEVMVKTCTGLRQPSIPSEGVSPIVYVYPWNLANPRLKRRRCRRNTCNHSKPLVIPRRACFLYRESKDSWT